MRHTPLKFSGLFIFLFSIVGLLFAKCGLAQDIAGVWECYVNARQKHSEILPDTNRTDSASDASDLPAKRVWPGLSEIHFYLSLEKQDDQWKAFFLNGDEKIEVPTVEVDGNKVRLRVDHYDSELSLKLVPPSDAVARHLSGTWKKRRGKNKWVEMNFSGTQSNNRSKQGKLTTSFDGTWKVKFEKSEDPAVGVFKMDPKTKRIDGTFLTTTGDYRYLSGYVHGVIGKTFEDFAAERVWPETMTLSCFDGAHAFEFRARIDGKGGLEGDCWSSDSWHETWTAQRDPNAKLPDDFKQTKLVKGCLLYTSPSPRDLSTSRMPSSA